MLTLTSPSWNLKLRQSFKYSALQVFMKPKNTTSLTRRTRSTTLFSLTRKEVTRMKDVELRRWTTLWRAGRSIARIYTPSLNTLFSFRLLTTISTMLLSKKISQTPRRWPMGSTIQSRGPWLKEWRILAVWSMLRPLLLMSQSFLSLKVNLLVKKLELPRKEREKEAKITLLLREVKIVWRRVERAKPNNPSLRLVRWATRRWVRLKLVNLALKPCLRLRRLSTSKLNSPTLWWLPFRLSNVC